MKMKREKFLIGFAGGQLRIILFDLLSGAEQDTGLAGLDHAQVVVAVAGGDGLKADTLQGFDGGQLALFHPDAVTGDHTVFPDLQLVAEDGGPAQFLHQGRSKLGKGVGQNDRLGFAAQGVQEFLRAGHGIDGGNGVLNILQAQAVLPQDAQPPFHQLVIVRLVPGGAFQFGDAAGLGKGDPDLRHQHPFKVKTYNIHTQRSASDGSKGILSETADRADPILRNIFPGSAGSNAAFRVADFGIIDIAAGTFVLHVISSFLFLLRNRLYAVSLSGLIISNGGGFVNRQSPGELIYFLPSENRR